MMKRAMIAVAAAALSICLAGCSQGGGASAAQEQPAPAPDPVQPEMVTSGYTEPDETGYMTFWGVMSNPNEEFSIEKPGFRATAYDEEGNVIDSEEFPIYLSSRLIVPPGDEYAMNGVLSVGSSAVSEVKIEAVCEDTPESEGFAPTYEISKTSTNVNGMGWVTAAGEIANNGEDEARYQVSCVLFDADGNSVDAGFTWAEDVPAGGSVPFSIDLIGGVQDFDHAEFYATQDLNA